MTILFIVGFENSNNILGYINFEPRPVTGFFIGTNESPRRISGRGSCHG